MFQAGNIEIPEMIPGTLFQLIVTPTIAATNKDTKTSYRNKHIKVTCGCPVDIPYKDNPRSTDKVKEPKIYDKEALKRTETSGAPINLTVLQVI